VLDTNQATVSVTVYLRLTADGPLEKETITGKFNVHRPTTAQATPYQPDGTPSAVITNITYHIWMGFTINRTLPSLSLGDGNRHNDMSFSNTITADNFSAGQAGYVQLITSADIQTHPYGLQTAITGLDGALGEFPRGTPQIPTNTTTGVSFFEDIPGISWLPKRRHLAET
jgi:hypothetical protein